MKQIMILLAGLCLTLQATAAVKTYQVTGPVVEITDSTIVVDKSGEKWVLQKDAATKNLGDVKVGSKVTVKYSMQALEIEAKAEKAKGK